MMELLLKQIKGIRSPLISPLQQYDTIAELYEKDAKKAIDVLERIFLICHLYPDIERKCIQDIQTFGLFVNIAQSAVNNPIKMKRLLQKKYTFQQLLNFDML